MLVEKTEMDEAISGIYAQIFEIAQILAPLAVLRPVGYRIARAFTLEWRFTLMRGYLDTWGERAMVEGASQRVQEDTKKFADGMLLVLRELVGAAFALIVFTPQLVKMGAKIAPTFVPAALGGWWLVILALSLAALGLIVAAFVARNLVSIDISNQKVEAQFRKRLVQAEASADDDRTKPGAPPAPDPPSVMQMVQRQVVQSVQPRDLFELWSGPRKPSDAPAAKKAPADAASCDGLVASLEPLLGALLANYNSMYNNFISIDAWNVIYSNSVVVLPYVFCAPRLFVPDSGVSVGDLMALRFIFFDVFFSLNAFAMNWPEINDLRATAQRLAEFEGSSRAGWHGARDAAALV